MALVGFIARAPPLGDPIPLSRVKASRLFFRGGSSPGGQASFKIKKGPPRGENRLAPYLPPLGDVVETLGDYPPRGLTASATGKTFPPTQRAPMRNRPLSSSRNLMPPPKEPRRRPPTFCERLWGPSLLRKGQHTLRREKMPGLRTPPNASDWASVFERGLEAVPSRRVPYAANIGPSFRKGD